MVEDNNDEARASENEDIKRRAENLDKMEEIYDKILEDKEKGLTTRCTEVLDGIDVDDSKPYFRMTSTAVMNDDEIEELKRQELESAMEQLESFGSNWHTF